MQLTYGQLEMVLSLHLQIHPDKVPTFRSRLKQLQRLEFPPGVNVGRGSKMTYTAEHLFMLVTVFEILGFGLPAQTACKLVTLHWEHFSAGYALTALQRRRFREGDKEQVLAVVYVHSLYEIQFSQYGSAEFSSVKICDRGAAEQELVTTRYTREHSRLIISVSGLFDRVLDIARTRTGVVGATIYDKEYHGWLPLADARGYNFKGYYPDRSNLKLRKEQHSRYKNDPDCLTQEGVEEANQFLLNDYDTEAPF